MNVKEKIREQIEAVSVLAQNYTCQLFFNLKRVGSGFFIQVDDDYFLVSAAHVLEIHFIEGMKFPNGKELVPIKGKLLVTAPPEGFSRSSDKIDFSVIKLDSDTVNEVKKQFKFLSAEHIDIDHKTHEDPQYLLFGYPNEWTTVIAAKEQIIPRPLIMRTKMVDIDNLKLESYEQRSKFAVEYDPLKFISDDGDSKKKLPNPKGMSGSALWYIPFKKFVDSGAVDLKLIGLVTDYHSGLDKVIAATNISVITETIRQKMEANIKESEEVKIKTKK